MIDNEEEKKAPNISIPTTLQRVLPRVIPGAVSPQNKDAVDWGWQGFLAFGSQAIVVIVDPKTLQCAQTLNKHKTHVTHVKWQKGHHNNQLRSLTPLILASTDTVGIIYIWNVIQGSEMLAVLQDGHKQVAEMEWLPGDEGNGREHLLLALHPPYSIILWDTRHAVKVWKKTFTDIITSFALDPFHSNQLAFMSTSCLLFIDDFDVIRAPSSNGNRFCLGVAEEASDDSGGRDAMRRSVRRKLVPGGAAEARTRGEDSGLEGLMEVCYDLSEPNRFMLLFAREFLVIDLEAKHVVACVTLDPGASAFVKVQTCIQQSTVFCMHDTGAVSVYSRICNTSTENEDRLDRGSSPSCSGEVSFSRRCQSDALRLARSQRPNAIALCRASEYKLALVLGDGRVIFKELCQQHSSEAGRVLPFMQNYSMLSDNEFDGGDLTSKALNLAMKDNYFGTEKDDTIIQNIKKFLPIQIPVISLAQVLKPTYQESSTKNTAPLRLHITGLLSSLSAGPHVIRMCPPLTTRNLHCYVPHLATGSHSGSVQIVNLATGVIEREFALHTNPVRGLEWTSLTSILSFASQPLTGAQGKVRNVLLHTDTRTGHTIKLRTNKTEESPIVMVKVSYLKQYFLVLLKEDPFELWDCRSLTLLRTMPRKFPRVTALEWSPTTHFKARKDSSNSQEQKKQGEEAKDLTPTTPTEPHMKMSLSGMSLSDIGDKAIIKENLVFTDGEGQLYRFSVEGNVIKDSNKNPADPRMSTITCVARKSSELVLSDVEGCLCVLELRAKTCRHLTTGRGAIRKIRFAPGKDNMKLLVLFADGIDVWDVKESGEDHIGLVSQLKSSPRWGLKVLDADWGASDRIVLATTDGALRVMDLMLNSQDSPMNQYYTKEPLVSPYLLSGEAALNLRTMLLHQPWKEKYSLQLQESDGFTIEQAKAISIWVARMSPVVCMFLETNFGTKQAEMRAFFSVLRAYVVSHVIGDRGEVVFWSVVAHYLSKEVERRMQEGTEEEIDEEQKADVKNIDDGSFYGLSFLNSSFSYLCDNESFKKHELDRLLNRESRSDLSLQTRSDLGRRLSVLGQRDRVVRMLLDGDPAPHQQADGGGGSRFYEDCLRACLLAATHHSTQATSTIKLVATNLIAAGSIWEGIELLCVIGKAADACRYLQSSGQWTDATWLAKCVLPRPEVAAILRRWATYLIHAGKKDAGICVLLSIADFSSALEHLAQQNYHQRAAILLHALLQLGIVEEDPNYNDADKNSQSAVGSSKISSALKHNIYKKYVLYLYGLGNLEAVRYFCLLLGESGRELLKELEAM